MKKILSVTTALFFAGVLSTQAQTVKKVTDKIDTVAIKAGNKTVEVASKGKAKITDEVYKDAAGPDGETVYIDNHDRYYWIDRKGQRHDSDKADLKLKSE